MFKRLSGFESRPTSPNVAESSIQPDPEEQISFDDIWRPAISEAIGQALRQSGGLGDGMMGKSISVETVGNPRFTKNSVQIGVTVNHIPNISSIVKGALDTVKENPTPMTQDFLGRTQSIFETFFSSVTREKCFSYCLARF